MLHERITAIRIDYFGRMQRPPLTSIFCSFIHGNSNLIQILLIFLGGALCLLPLTGNPSIDLSHSDLLNAVPSQRNRDSAVAAFALGLPILGEVIVEMITSISTEGKSEKVKIHLGGQLLNTRERFLMALGILTIPITAFLPEDTVDLVNIYLCLRKCRFIFVGGTIITSLCRYDVAFWTVKKSFSIVVCLVIGSVMGSFSENGSLRGRRSTHELAGIAYGFFILALCILLYCNARWFLSVIPSLFSKQALKPWRDGVSQKDPQITDAQLLLPLLYVFTTGLVSIIICVIFRVSPEIDAYNSDALFYHHLALIMYVIFLMYLSDRMMKYDVIRGLVSATVHTCVL